ncbi:MAG: hypothetical protein JWQ61_2851 [Collimonas fungivorans]|uniref:hypothetical protein n=1 Tax=Collimonas fungivorans TaxID=158899 RepID=UPI0026F1AB7D|nr:hypothetical protein [Collimonas fungivorans]MDB5768037.1 hypothetical protein [Collimonas fungivorans]
MSSQIKTQPRTISPTLTGAGVMAAINVPKTGVEVAVSHIAFGTGKYRPNGAEIGLQHEMMRVAIAGGGKVSPTQIQVHAEAIAPAGSPFWCGEIGFYAGDTLFAVYSKSDQPILYFADDSVTTVSYTLGLTALPSDSVSVLVDPNVNTAIQLIGAHETAGDPHPQYLTQVRGDSRYYRKLPAYTNSDTDCDILLETGVRDVSVANDRGVIAATRLPMGADGYGTLTTENGGQFVQQVYAEATIAHRTWERTGYLGANNPFEGHDWKLLWDAATFDPGAKQDKLGFTPIQQGTGIGQTANAVKVGWSDGAGLKATVDKTDMGSFVFGDRSIRINWKGLAGQPSGLLGGAAAGDVNLYDPLNFDVNSAQKANSVTNGADWMKFMWGDSGGQTAWVWGSDGPTSARLMTTNNLRVGYARTAGIADIVASRDTRASNYAPQDRNVGAYFDMKSNAAAGLNDGGSYHGAMTFRPWGEGVDFSGGNAHQFGFTDSNNVWYRSGKGTTWSGWSKFWHSGNFDPGSKVNGAGIALAWSGMGGQPSWLLGGNAPGDVRVYNPSNFNVSYANSANYATSAGNADKWAGMPLRYAENPLGNQPYYILAIEAGHNEFSIYNRTALAVGSAVNAVYANQLTGPGLQNQSIGGYILNKNWTSPEVAGAWEPRGYAYDFGSGGDGGGGTRTALWQRVA